MMRGVCSLLLLLVALPAAAGEDAFYRAAALERDGHPAEARAAFSAIADAGAGDPFADDALLEMGRISEERLGDPVGAAAAYERLVREHPQSRLATRAQRRAEALRQAMGPDAAHAAAVAEMNDILAGYAGRPRGESIARMERLLAADPGFPAAAHATFWLGTTLEADGQRGAALARYREVARRWPVGVWAARAARSEGDLLLLMDDLDAAELAYRRIATADPRAGDLFELAVEKVDTARGRRQLARVCYAVLAALAAAALVATWRGARSLRPLLRPPFEALYLIPVALVFVAAGLTENQSLSNAISVTCAGGLVVAWLSGAALEAARAGGRRVTAGRAVAHVAAAATAVAGICYIALWREGLVDFVVDTLRHGPDG